MAYNGSLVLDGHGHVTVPAATQPIARGAGLAKAERIAKELAK